jgi:glycosyltransferase involved in cell wall biosynthesis
MHILHCLTHSTFGGGQAVPFLLIKNLLQSRPEFRHTVMAPMHGEYEERFRSIGVNFIGFPLNRIHPAPFLRIRSLLHQLRPNVVHSHGRGAGLYLRSIPRSVLPAGRVHTHHGFHVPESLTKKMSFIVLERFLNSNTDVHIAVSASEEKEIQSVVTPHRSIALIPNIVDPAQVAQDATADPQNALLFDRFTVALIGRSDPIKNYPLAIRVAEEILRQTNAIQFLFIGAGTDQPVISALQTMYPDNIQVTGAIRNPLPLLRRSSLLLMTSKREGSPLSVLEALALGKPVVGSNVRGLKDIVQHGETGFLSDGSPEEMAQRIIELMNNQKLYQRLSKNAVAYTALHCNVQKWCEEYAHVYATVNRPC